MHRPLSVFSIEAIFSHMKIEKVWEVRKENATLRQVINSTEPSKTKKWRINRLEINGDKIGHDMDDPSCHSLLKGTHVTRWMTCGILIIKDISLEHLQSSLLPVGRTLCKDTVSVEIKSSKTESSEFVKSFTQLLTFIPHLRALSVHIPNLNESQLCKLVDNLSWRSKDFVGEIVFLSINASSEVTEKFMNQFMEKTSIRNNRMLLIKAPEEDEVFRVPTEAISLMFMKSHPMGCSKRDQLVIEKMEKTAAIDLFDELRRTVPRGYSIEEESGRMEFRESDGLGDKVLMILDTF